jgi:hypothetical protein
MSDIENRERVIRTAWAERGKAQWNPETHGRGLVSLHIPANPDAKPPPFNELEFRMVRTFLGERRIDSIVCDDVVVEVAVYPDSAPTGWLNQDDASNQVVQIVAENQRRNMAAISSGEVFVSTPSEGEITFADKEAVEIWLRDQSDDVAVVFAARAALRVLPAFRLQPTAGLGQRTSHVLLLQVFRAVATAWATARFPKHRDNLQNLATNPSTFHRRAPRSG